MKRHLTKLVLLLIALGITLASASDLAVIRAKGNATVPDNVPIQPLQAFVDVSVGVLTNGSTIGIDISVESKGVTSLSPSWLHGLFTGFGEANLHASGNAITNTNAILAQYVADVGIGPADLSVIDLSGGTNAAPTGQGLTDKQTMIDNGWSVTTN